MTRADWCRSRAGPKDRAETPSLASSPLFGPWYHGGTRPRPRSAIIPTVRRLVLLLILLVGLSACVRAGFDSQTAPQIESDSAPPADRSLDAPLDQVVDLAEDLALAIDGVISDLDWARCSDPSAWTCTEDATGQCDASCHGAFWTWCKGGVVCGCGGLGQGLSYIQKSTTDCATCLVTGPACVAYYAGLP